MGTRRRTSRVATSSNHVDLTNSMPTRDQAVPIRYLSPSDPMPASTTVGSHMDHPWTLTPHQALGHFHVDSTTGLSLSQVAKHTEIYGANGAYPLISICYAKEN